MSIHAKRLFLAKRYLRSICPPTLIATLHRRRSSVAHLLVPAFALVSISQASAHCDAAYAHSPTIAYVEQSRTVLDRRTSYFSAEKELEARVNRGRGNSPPVPPTSSQLRSAMPPQVVTPQALDDVSRQRSLTHWLVYIRKLYEENKFASVVDAISEMRVRNILRDADGQGGFDGGDVDTKAYFSLPVLTRIFVAYEKAARLGLLSGNSFNEGYRKALQDTVDTQLSTFNFAELPDPRSNFTAQEYKEYLLPKVREAALRPAVIFAESELTKPKWDRLANLAGYDEVLGISDDLPGRPDVYLQAGQGVAAIVIDQKARTAELVPGLDCRGGFESALGTIAATFAKSDEKAVLSALVKANDRYVLTIPAFGGHVYITENQLTSLMAGEKIDDPDFQTAISLLLETNASLILWSHPMMQKAGAARDATIRFAHALGRAYPKLNVVIDSPNVQVPALAAQISSLSISPQDVLVVIDGQYSVKFQGELADQAEELRKLVGTQNVVFFDGKEPVLAPSPRRRAVIVITGHSDIALEKFIEHLAEKGYLKDNLVVLESCGGDLSPRLVAKINSEYGAAGTFHYAGKILEVDAVAHTKEILGGLKSGSAFGRLVRDRAAKPSKAWQGKMEGVWTICDTLVMALKGLG